MSLFLLGFLLKGSQKLDCQLLTCLFATDNKGINYFYIKTKLLLFLIALGLRLPRFTSTNGQLTVTRVKIKEEDVISSTTNDDSSTKSAEAKNEKTEGKRRLLNEVYSNQN